MLSGFWSRLFRRKSPKVEPVDIDKALADTAEIDGEKLAATDIVKPKPKEKGRPQEYESIIEKDKKREA